MTCFQCKGETENRYKTHAAVLDNCVIIIKNVPALVCVQCGEVYFSDNVMQSLEIITDKLEGMIREVAIVNYVDNVA
jgi:YgiT-type zinc finger domain-containing protein